MRAAPPIARARPRMDRPEWVAVHPKTGEVYCALTNNANRGKGARPAPDPANPRADNVFGHIVRWRERGGDAGGHPLRVGRLRPLRRSGAGGCRQAAAISRATSSDRRTGSGSTSAGSSGSRPMSPPACWARATTRAWATTRCSPPIPATREVRRFLTGPSGCEVTGVVDHARRDEHVRQHPAPGRDGERAEQSRARPRR